ncbi:hypothetical protein DB346_17415 [Verrucomicrobia bacterium LW23]|nr:hypothetical protein DB346_17415 [Verrucomicrobia bacterium LW23]
MPDPTDETFRSSRSGRSLRDGFAALAVCAAVAAALYLVSFPLAVRQFGYVVLEGNSLDGLSNYRVIVGPGDRQEMAGALVETTYMPLMYAIAWVPPVREAYRFVFEAMGLVFGAYYKELSQGGSFPAAPGGLQGRHAFSCGKRPKQAILRS